MSHPDAPVAAVSGAAGDLGRAMLARLAADGVRVAGSGRSAERLEEARVAAGIAEEAWHAHVADLADPEAASGWREAVVERFGNVDWLLHVVGGWRGGQPITEAPPADYAWLHEQLVTTTQNVTRAFARDLAGSEGGRFVIVSSSQAVRPTADNAAYATAKAAAEAWTLAFADGLASTRATANIVAVNAILTRQMREASPDKAFASFTPAEDVADAIAFLCSPAAERMNGRRLALHP